MTRANKTQEDVAAALNEQGGILRGQIIGLLQSGTGRQNHEWLCEGPDVPVSLPNHYDIRVDIVLKRRPFSHLLDSMSENQLHVVMKCKPAERHYDSWVFYSQVKASNSALSNRYHIESAEALSSFHSRYEHKLNSSYAAQECPVFDRFVEARIESPLKRYKRPSPESINGALRQVTLGQTGIANKLRWIQTQMFSLIPVVVTTAKLISTPVDLDNVSQNDANLPPQDLKLESRKWLALNYHISDIAAQFFAKNHVKPTSIAGDLSSRLVRTIFVVQADHILPFLDWLNKSF